MKSGRTSGAEELAGFEPATCRLEIDNPLPAARRSAGERLARNCSAAELQPSHPDAHGVPPTAIGALGSRVSFSTSRRRQPSCRCACIVFKQPLLTIGTKNAPPAWCAGGAFGSAPLGHRASARSPPILRCFVPSGPTRVDGVVYRYVVASSGLSARMASTLGRIPSRAE